LRLHIITMVAIVQQAVNVEHVIKFICGFIDEVVVEEVVADGLS
jgi:hypothetical protein